MNFLEKNSRVKWSRDPDIIALFCELLEIRALQSDKEMSNKLLKNLVLRYASTEQKLKVLNRELDHRQELLNDDLKAAAKIQEALLPQKSLALPGVPFAGRFAPSELIGGDVFQLFPYDAEHLVVYIMDVSGHGVPSAMVTVSISQTLNPISGLAIAGQKGSFGKPPALSPGIIVEILEKEYPLERFDKLFTFIYAVLNVKTGILTYANAGHPFPVLIEPEAGLRTLEKYGPLIGMGVTDRTVEAEVRLKPGTRLFLYTDGVTEAQNPKNQLFGEKRLFSYLERTSSLGMKEVLEGLEREIREFRRGRKPGDDMTYLMLEYSGSGVPLK